MAAVAVVLIAVIAVLVFDVPLDAIRPVIELIFDAGPRDAGGTGQ